MKSPRFKLCFIVALISFCIAPYLSSLLPGGGKVEQRWLDQVISHLEAQCEVCEDTYIKEAMELAIERYSVVKPFGVRVMQLPEGVDGLNHVLCRGITIDCAMLTEDIRLGALVVVHETMHDMPPYIGHTHIDNQRIMGSL